MKKEIKFYKCKLCRAEFDNSPLIYCGDCMDLMKAIGTYLQKQNIEKNNKKVAKILWGIRVGKYDYPTN